MASDEEPEFDKALARRTPLVRRQSMLRTTYNLEFTDVEYKIEIPDPNNKKQQITKQIIQPISGSVSPSRMLALMGSSGAGKSSLLDILAGRLATSARLGSVTLNGRKVNSATFRKLSGYVMQEDALLPLFNVRETLRFAARLRMGANLPTERIDQLVNETIDMLNLNNAADTIVGDELNRGISGGEKRRVSIGADIIHQPAIIFLDEPTSGLDSTTALHVVATLRLLCETGRTIVVTVHQPSMRVFNSFDQVLFLNHGKAVYHGPTDEVVSYMQQKGIEAPSYINIPEFFLEKVHEYETGGKLDELEQTGHPTASTSSDDDMVQLSSRASMKTDDQLESTKVEFLYANSVWGETKVLIQRNASNLFRTKELFFARICLSVLMGLVLGSLFFDANSDEKAGYMIFGVAFFMFTSLEALPIFIMERNVFTRESSRGSYRTCSYALAASIVAIPYQIVPALIFVSISYYMVGLEPGAESFFLYLLGQMGVLIVGNAKAMLISTLVNDPMLGTTAGTALFAIFFLFSGFFIPRDDIPGYWLWMHYLGSFTWCFEALAIAGFDKSDPEERGALEFFSLDDLSVWRGIGIVYCYALVVRFLFYIVLKYKHRGVRT